MTRVIAFTTVLLMSFNLMSQDVLRLVTTTSTENSGLTEYLISHFTDQTGIRVHVIAVGTGKALAIARNGDTDAILVHSKPDEIEFVERGYGKKRYDVMYNDFIVVGPRSLESAVSIDQVLKQIVGSGSVFISRGDDSGTHKKELQLWQNAEINPDTKWYRDSGQGMGKTLQIASELQAYTLTDRGTWLAQNVNQALELEIVFEGGEQLYNPYGIIAINPEKFPHVNANAGQVFIDWLISDIGQTLIGDFKIHGEQLFFPAAN